MRHRYRKGANLERRLKKRLEAQGYTVFRVAGSKGPADLVAIKNSQAYLIQVKSNRISNREIKRLDELAAKCGAFPVIAIWDAKHRRWEVEVYGAQHLFVRGSTENSTVGT